MLFFKSKPSMLAILMTAVFMNHAQACGPLFSPILVLDHKVNLLTLPEGDAYFEIEKLLPKKEFTFVVDKKSEIETTELNGLNEKQSSLVKAMRALTDPALAYEAGKSLPEAIRLYTAGAVAYNAANARQDSHDDSPADDKALTTVSINKDSLANNIAFAREKFLAILMLSDTEKKSRVVWAAYMLGKLASHEQNPEQATQYFSMVRQLVNQNNKDDLGLAVSSYGEEAKVYYAIATGKTNLPQAVSIKDAYIKAVNLYAQEAAYGSASAYDSLRIVIADVVGQNDLLAQLMQNSLIQQLVFAYAFSGYFDEPSRLALFALMDQQKIENIPNADVVAAFAYRAGRYQLAEHYVAKSKTPLAHWISAKLALQKGDQGLALTAYAEAIKAFPVDEKWSSIIRPDIYREDINLTPNCLVNTEMGILQLERSEYIQALHYLYAGAKDYWMDAAYVAERIITTDELKTFVEQQVPVPISEQIARAKETYTVLPEQKIRDLLARRLMRDKRYHDALAFFTDATVRKKAQDYADYLQKTQSPLQPKTMKAKALFNASLLARYDGMELMGFEGAPDFTAWDGMFEYGSPDVVNDKFISDDEKARYRASGVTPEKRFHYRFVAADLANQSASLLPARSQAFAAVLCKGSHYLLARYPEDAQPLYQRYIKEGAFVPWAKDFGQVCPEPEFTRAIFQYPLEKYAQLKRHF